MEITNIEVLNLRYDYPADKGFTFAGGRATGRLTTLVRVETDTGHTGIGSAYTHPILARGVVEHLVPHLVGLDATAVEENWTRMYSLTRWYGRAGVAMSTLGAIDTALWDLRGQDRGEPVWKLLGGTEPSVAAYASGLLWNDDMESLAAEAHRHVDDGFRRVKMRLGRTWNYDRLAFQTVKSAVGPNVDVMVDGSMRYSFDDAVRLGRLLSEDGTFWFEEPFAPEDLESFRRLRRTISVPLAAGENECSAAGFEDLARGPAVDIMQPDASRAGGISAVWNVCELGAERGLRVATHSWSDAVAVMANAHAIAAADARLTVEVDRTGTPFVDELLTTPLEIRDGRLMLSHAPGLGITLDEETVARYLVTEDGAIPPGIYSDMAFGPFAKTGSIAGAASEGGP